MDSTRKRSTSKYEVTLSVRLVEKIAQRVVELLDERASTTPVSSMPPPDPRGLSVTCPDHGSRGWVVKWPSRGGGGGAGTLNDMLEFAGMWLEEARRNDHIMETMFLPRRCPR